MPTGQFIYWTVPSENKILRSALDGTNVEVFLEADDGIIYPRDIAVDIHNEYIYWVGSMIEWDVLFRTDFSRTKIDTIIDPGGDININTLALDPEHGKIYFIGSGEGSSIYRSNFDGSGIEQLIWGDSYLDMVVDYGQNTIYYIDGSYQINRCDLDGSNDDAVSEPGNDPIYLALDAWENKLYYIYYEFRMDFGIEYIDLETIDEYEVVGGFASRLLALNITLPSAPIHLSATANVGYTEISWPASPEANITSYKLFRGITSHPETELIEVISSIEPVATYKDYDINHDQEYYYRLVAVDDNGFYSGYSVEDTVTAIGPPNIELSKTMIDFGEIDFDATSVDSFAIYNTGGTDLDLWTIDLLHYEYFDWEEFIDMPETISPGDSMWFYVRFEPEIGSFTDSISIVSDDYFPETDSLIYIALKGASKNLGPLPFGLIAPAIYDSLTDAEFIDMTFIWQEAVDPDGDTLVYNLTIGNFTFDTTFINLADTTLNLDLSTFLEYDSVYAWSVFASDGEFLIASADTFGFYAPVTATAIDDEWLTGVPSEFKLHSNYPNPFNPSTTIRYDLPSGADVQLVIYNIAGQIVCKLVNEYQNAGFQNAVWDGKDGSGNIVSTGIYLYMIKAGAHTAVKKMTLIK